MHMYLFAFALGAITAGSWKGAIELPQAELGIRVVLYDTEDGWSGSIDIPMQNVRGLELSGLAIEGSRVRFEMAGVPGQPTFEGELSEGGDAITGTFHQSGQSLPFALQRASEEEESSGDLGLPADPIPGDGIVGDWLGPLQAGPVTLRLALHVEEMPDGSVEAVLDSVDQGALISVETVTLNEEGTVQITLDQIGASFQGRMSENGSAIEGTWSQGGRELPLTFHRLAKRFALERPQNPEGPFPYANRDVTFPSASGDVTLAGTLLIPEGEGPFPAVALASGSGPQDRDESLMGHKPFLVIADSLARRGIASLRWDDRGTGESTGDHTGSTVSEFVGDIRGAVTFLAAQPEIDRDAIGVIGHSEGGLTGPIAAVAEEEIDFLVLLAPPGVPILALLERQTRDVYAQQGLDSALIDKALAMQKEDLAMIADSSLGDGELRAKLQARVEERRARFTEEELALLQADEQAIEQGVQAATTPWFRSLAREDASAYLRQLAAPVLALFGEKDIQVAAEPNAQAVRAALAQAGNPDYEVRILPGLNHLFQHAETGSVAEYGAIEETFAPEALELVGAWIEARFGTPSRETAKPAAD